MTHDWTTINGVPARIVAQAAIARGWARHPAMSPPPVTRNAMQAIKRNHYKALVVCRHCGRRFRHDSGEWQKTCPFFAGNHVPVRPREAA